MKTKLRAVVFAALLITGTLQAQVPQLINYGGRVVVGTVNFDGNGQFKFAFVNADGTTTFWSNDGTSTGGSEPTAAVTLPVAKGLYSVLLGNATLPNMTVVPATVFTNADVRLRVWFSDGMSGFQLMTPDQRIAAVGYAMMAATAQTVPDGAITSAKIAAGAVGGSQIAAGAVGSTQIAAGAVGSSQIAAGAVSSTQLAAGAITAEKMAKPVRSGSIASSSISFDISDGGSFVVPFAPPFGTVPNVTLSLRGAINGPAAAARVFLTDCTASQFSATVVLDAIWMVQIATVDNTFDIGLFTSLVVVNGNPAISYYDRTNLDLKYVRALDASGTTWGTPVTLASTGAVGLWISLAVVNGNPAISYHDDTNGDLKYVRALDANGTSWGTPVTPASIGTVGLCTSLVVVNGNPAISYYDVTTQDLKYVRATDASGTSWGTPVTPASTGDVGQHTSLVVVNGNPAISYYDLTNGDLKYVRALDASGTTWGTPVTLASTGDVGLFNSLAVVNGNPAISYWDQTNGRLKYVRITDPAPFTIQWIAQEP